MGNKSKFLKELQFEVDPDEELIIDIQRELKNTGINKKNALLLTKKLSEKQRK